MILADLGVSSMQIDNPERGFSFKKDGPLDMRMNQKKGETASHLLNRITENKIASLLRDNADEPDACIIAHAIFQNRTEMKTTMDLQENKKSTLSELKRSDNDIVKIRTTRYIKHCVLKLMEAFSAGSIASQFTILLKIRWSRCNTYFSFR
jgi:16S rRNA (cytosine1402-N4)-methyltransferase